VSLTPWRVTGLIVIAAIAVAIAVLDASKPPAPLCQAPQSSLHNGLLTQSGREFTAILIKEPSSGCAKKGMRKVARRWCLRGDSLKVGGATAEAVKAYDAALDIQPFFSQTLSCGADGLRRLSRKGVPAECRGSLKPQCVELIVDVNGVNGKNGLNGRNGANGLAGRNGGNGLNGKSGKAGASGRNGSNGRNGVNGKNGANGHSGLNGHNGGNGRNGHNGRNGMNGTSYEPCGAVGCS
jgi:hypothetical protein